MRFRASVRSHSSAVSSRNGTIVPLPALATKMFISGTSERIVWKTSAMRLAIRRVGNERDHGLRGAGAGPQLLARVLQRLHASGDDHDVGARIDEAGGDAEADPLAGARDRRPLSGEWSVLDRQCS